jgi:hypothetical protein
MESSVASQISPTTYSADVFKLYKNDINAESELFEINIFNTTLHIAPGNSISGNDGLVYFYVYAIKDEKVIANLGVYELITDEQKKLYDISTFDNLLLFDYYYTTPSKIKEFEIKGKNNIFDYIYTHLEAEKDKKRLVSIFNEFLAYIKGEKDALGDNYKLYHAILTIISSDIKTVGISKEVLDKIHDKCDTEKKRPIEMFKISLAILEAFYSVHFLLTDNGETVSNFRDKTPSQSFKPKQYIIVSMDQTFVSTSSTLKPEVVEDEEIDAADEMPDPIGKAKTKARTKVTFKNEATEAGEGDEAVEEADVEGADVEGADVEEGADAVEGAELLPEGETVTEDESAKPKIKTKNTPRPRLPKSKFASEDKSESKAESKSESKAESKSESKAESKSKLERAQRVVKSKTKPPVIEESEPKAKGDSKRESKSLPQSDGKTKVKSKLSKLSNSEAK